MLFIVINQINYFSVSCKCGIKVDLMDPDYIGIIILGRISRDSIQMTAKLHRFKTVFLF